jgi:hypothetical protein
MFVFDPQEIPDGAGTEELPLRMNCVDFVLWVYRTYGKTDLVPLQMCEYEVTIGGEVRQTRRPYAGHLARALCHLRQPNNLPYLPENADEACQYVPALVTLNELLERDAAT